MIGAEEVDVTAGRGLNMRSTKGNNSGGRKGKRRGKGDKSRGFPSVSGVVGQEKRL